MTTDSLIKTAKEKSMAMLYHDNRPIYMTDDETNLLLKFCIELSDLIDAELKDVPERILACLAQLRHADVAMNTIDKLARCEAAIAALRGGSKNLTK